MTIQLLKYNAVAEAGSITGAAKQLHSVILIGF